ncbi:MAG: peptidoglycan DD-metalloendopeptidase family protein [Rikenellaceae bacterium]
MNYRWKISMVVTLLLFGSATLFGQSPSLEGLRSEREKAEREIERLDAELLKLKSSNDDLSGQLNIFTQRLTQRNKVLSSINNQIKILDNKEAKQSREATRYSQEIQDIRTLYNSNLEMLYLLELRLEERGALLLSDSLRQRKLYYEHLSHIMLNRLSEKNREVDSLHGAIGVEIRQILEHREELVELKREESVAVEQIQGERAKIEALRSELGLKSSGLLAEKDKQQKAIDELQQQIQAIIEAEMKQNSSTQLLDIGGTSSSFERLKGTMISPMMGAKVVDIYGIHNHPSQSGIKVDNKGVNLQGLAGGTVRVVASGEVRKIFNVGGMGTSVLVRHGQYLTVYSSLDVVSVKVGDKVMQGQNIGKVSTNGLLHFEIWHETQTENPTHWIKF